MNDKQRIAPFSAGCMLMLYMLSALQTINLFPHEKTWNWLSVLLAVAVSVPALLVCGRLCVKNPDRSFPEILKRSCGKVFGTILCVLYFLYALYGASLALRLLAEFIHIVSFPKTPEIIVIFMFGFLCARALGNGKRSFSEFCVILFPAVALIVLMIALLSAGLYHAENFGSLSTLNPKDVFVSSVDICAFTFGETVLFLGFLPFVAGKDASSAGRRRSVGRVITFGTLAGAVIISGIVLSNLLVLGKKTAEKLYFPYYAAVSLINISDFITHIEVIAVITVIFTTVVRAGVCLGVASDCLCSVFDIREKIFYPLGFCASAIALALFDRPPELVPFSEAGKYFGLIFHLILPIIVLICYEIGERKQWLSD